VVGLRRSGLDVDCIVIVYRRLIVTVLLVLHGQFQLQNNANLCSNDKHTLMLSKQLLTVQFKNQSRFILT